MKRLFQKANGTGKQVVPIEEFNKLQKQFGHLKLQLAFGVSGDFTQILYMMNAASFVGFHPVVSPTYETPDGELMFKVWLNFEEGRGHFDTVAYDEIIYWLLDDILKAIRERPESIRLADYVPEHGIPDEIKKALAEQFKEYGDMW